MVGCCIYMKDEDIRRSKKMKEWRRKVRRRDRYTCQMCNSRRYKGHWIKLHVHHIVRFVDIVESRFFIDNGITLCAPCHCLTYGKERDYEQLFNDIILGKKG
jgi:5-methylcytosine-specific restriction endonuclease McrA